MENYSLFSGSVNPDITFNVLGYPEGDIDEDESPETKQKKKKVESLETIVSELIKSKAILLTDGFLLPNIPMNSAYLIESGDYHDITSNLKLSALQDSLKELGLPIYIFDFKKRSVTYYFDGVYVEDNDFPNKSSDHSVFYYFSKARLDKDYLRDLSKLYI